jgi:hypothetical protein
MARSLDYRPEFRGWIAVCDTQRQRVRAKLETIERRRRRSRRMEIDDVDEPLTTLSDALDDYSLEIRK